MRAVFEFYNRSLFGHVVVYEVLGSPAMFIWYLVENYNEGTITLLRAVQFAAEVVAVFFLVAFAIWHTVTLPLLRQSKKKAGQ